MYNNLEPPSPNVLQQRTSDLGMRNGFSNHASKN